MFFILVLNEFFFFRNLSCFHIFIFLHIYRCTFSVYTFPGLKLSKVVWNNFDVELNTFCRNVSKISENKFWLRLIYKIYYIIFISINSIGKLLNTNHFLYELKDIRFRDPCNLFIIFYYHWVNDTRDDILY